MFLYFFLTVSLLSFRAVWSLPFPRQVQISPGELLEKMDLRDIVLSVGPRHRAVLPVNQQQEPGHYAPNKKMVENIDDPAEYLEQANHIPQLELNQNPGTHHDVGNHPLPHLSHQGNDDGTSYRDTPVQKDLKMSPRTRHRGDLKVKRKNKQKMRRRKAISNSRFRSQSGSSDRSSSRQGSSNLRGIWDLLPPDLIDVPRVELTPEQMEEINETGRLCTEDGECVYFSGGWGEACCPFG